VGVLLSANLRLTVHITDRGPVAVYAPRGAPALHALVQLARMSDRDLVDVYQYIRLRSGRQANPPRHPLFQWQGQHAAIDSCSQLRVGRIASMGGRNSVAGLLIGLAVVVTAWVAPAVAADAWRLRSPPGSLPSMSACRRRLASFPVARQRGGVGAGGRSLRTVSAAG